MGIAVFKGEEINGRWEKGSEPDDWKYNSWIVVVCCSHDIGEFVTAKLLQKSEMRKDIVIELSYKGFG